MSKAIIFRPLNINTESAGGALTGSSEEREIVIYGKVTDNLVDDEYAEQVQEIEQANIFIPKGERTSGGVIRGRRINGSSYTKAMKVWCDEKTGERIEAERVSDADEFSMMRQLADVYNIKTRYSWRLDIPGYDLTLELDMYTGKNGPAEYAKIDIELPPGSFITPDSQIDLIKRIGRLSFATADMVIVLPGIRSEEASAKVRKITADWNVK